MTCVKVSIVALMCALAGSAWAADGPYRTEEPPSPFLDEVAAARFAEHEGAWHSLRRVVDFVRRKNARGASPLIERLGAELADTPCMEELTLLAAANQVNANRPDDATATLASWRESYPQSRLQGTAALVEGRALMARARALFSTRGEFPPPDAEVEYRRALRHYQGLLDAYGDRADISAPALMDMASLHRSLGEKNQAILRSLELLERHPTHPLAPRALYGLANTAWAEMDHGRAVELFHGLVLLYPEDGLAKRGRKNLAALATVGKPAPELVIGHWLTGETTLQALRGQTVMVLFWNEWCPHCRRALPDVQAQAERFADRGYQVVTVTKHTKGQTDEKVMDFLQSQELGLRCAVEPAGYTSTQDYGISGVPGAALVDRDGVVIWRNHPARLTDELLGELIGDDHEPSPVEEALP